MCIKHAAIAREAEGSVLLGLPVNFLWSHMRSFHAAVCTYLQQMTWHDLPLKSSL